MLSLAALGVELLLTRIFDVILWPNLSFLIISCAIFGLGLGGLTEVLRRSAKTTERLAAPAFGFAATVWAIPLFLNAIPFSVDQITTRPGAQLAWFLGLYLVLLAPFFFVGLCVCRIFSTGGRVGVLRLSGRRSFDRPRPVDRLCAEFTIARRVAAA